MRIETKLLTRNIKEQVITTDNNIIYKVFVYDYNISKIKIWRLEGAKEKLLFDAPVTKANLIKARIIYDKILNNEFVKEITTYERERDYNN